MEYDGVSNICYLDFSKGKIESSVKSQINSLKPAIPTHVVRLENVDRAAKWFLNNFNGKVLYSVKSNPEEKVLLQLHKSGVEDFDIASLNEIKLISRILPQAKMYFMHPIKSREAIFEAYFNYGIRDFSLDSHDELDKILAETNNAKDLSLHIRLSIPNSHAAIELSSKFGILPSDSVSLIRKARISAKTLGICFHVGSQCMEPSQYRGAIDIVKEVVKNAGVQLDILDIGGGFPSSYPSLTPPPLKNYIEEINDSLKTLDFKHPCQIWCEPGRALVAESGSLVVRVEARKNQMLYINDGTYGALFDAGSLGFIYPAKIIRLGNKPVSGNLIDFGFYGPTCDSIDVMRGPFYLPEDICEGDYIEIGGLGAYSKSIRTKFNGFDDFLEIETNDSPLISMYDENRESLLDQQSSKF